MSEAQEKAILTDKQEEAMALARRFGSVSAGHNIVSGRQFTVAASTVRALGGATEIEVANVLTSYADALAEDGHSRAERAPAGSVPLYDGAAS